MFLNAVQVGSIDSLNLLVLVLLFQKLHPKLTFTGDFEKRQFRDATLHFGLRAKLPKAATIRLGLNDSQPTFGAGYLWGKSLEFHYAFVTHDDNLDSDHIFGWAFIF